MIRLPYLCIKAENKHTMNTIMSLERIRYVKPEWQDVRKPKYTQCFNCYKLGHTRTGGCTNPRGCKACLEEGTNHVCTVKMLPEQDEEGNPHNKYAILHADSASRRDTRLHGQDVNTSKRR